MTANSRKYAEGRDAELRAKVATMDNCAAIRFLVNERGFTHPSAQEFITRAKLEAERKGTAA